MDQALLWIGKDDSEPKESSERRPVMHFDLESFANIFLEIALASLFILIAVRVLRELSRPSIEVSSEKPAQSQCEKAKGREYAKSMV